jgi:long-chain acyl-CoA synthetase
VAMDTERPWLRAWPKGVPQKVDFGAKPLFALLTDSANKYPSKACLSYQGRLLSYAEVHELSSRLASGLVSLGLKRGDRVAIFLPNIPQFVISYYATLMAGGIVVTCSPLYKPRELEHQLNDSGATIVVAARDRIRSSHTKVPNDLYKSLAEVRKSLSLKAVVTTSVADYIPAFKKPFARFAGVERVARPDTIDFVGLVTANKPMAPVTVTNPREEVAVLQYTGGTTGVAKGAMLTHYNLYSNALYLSKILPMSEQDLGLAVLPLYHIYGMTTGMNCALYSGAGIVLLPEFHVEEVMNTIQKQKVTVFCGVPAMYIAINNNSRTKEFDLRSVRACISGGAALPIAVRKKFMDLTGGNLVEGYGLSEASPVTHVNPVHDGVVKDGSIGIPIPETDAAIVDSNDFGKPLPTGQEGELAVRGPQVMKGYWNRPDESALVLRGGWLLTGDIARMDGDGYFFVIDRKKDMINVGGLKVYPREVEEVLFENPAVKEAAAIGIPDEFRGEVVKAFVVLKDPAGSTTKQDLIEFCSGRLSKYKVPKEIELVPSLPKTLIGKVLRRELRGSTESR